MTLPGDVRPDHAIVASIFSAAAVEAGLNLFISIPILHIKDENIRRFFGLLITKYLRLSVPQKLTFACEFCQQIKEDKALLGRVRELFEYRNDLLHSAPLYAEPWGPLDMEEHQIGEEGWIEVKGAFIRYPQLISRGFSTAEVEMAFEHYQTAVDFLSKLTVYGPAPEEST
jgi:hypothetical protein